MKLLLLACLAVILLGLPASAADGPAAAVQPAKPARSVTPPPPDPGALRQGGDTLADAVPLTLPAIDIVGTTAGYTNDYNEVCPYGFSTSPDVVYSFVPETDMVLDLDLCGSSYDTHMWVYDENLLDITESVTCVIECPHGAHVEGEPEIVDGYVDTFNGGCNSTPQVYFPLTSRVFCGKSGYYLNGTGLSSRDLDWFEIIVPASGVVEIVGDSEETLNLYEIVGSCDDLIWENGGVAGACAEFTLTITGAHGETVRVLAGATHFWEGFTYEFDYLLLTNIETGTATENHSWTSVKVLFE